MPGLSVLLSPTVASAREKRWQGESLSRFASLTFKKTVEVEQFVVGRFLAQVLHLIGSTIEFRLRHGKYGKNC